MEAEAIGWIPLAPGAYLHLGQEDDPVVEVVGIPAAAMLGLTVLLLLA